MKTRNAFVAAVLLVALAPASPAAAQDRPPDRPPAVEDRFLAGFRLGAFEMVNAPDSYDAVFGDPMPMLGIQAEWWLRPRIVLGATLDYGEVDGERVLPGNPDIGTGIDETLTYIPLHVTGAWRADRGGDWALLLGAGPSLLSWESDGGIGSSDGTDFGGHVVLSLRRPGARWTFGGDLLWSTFPDAVGQGGPSVTNFFDEDDPGGVSVHFVVLRGF